MLRVKTWSTLFYLKVPRLKMRHLKNKKLPCPSPMLRKIEWQVQNGSITKNKVLSLTTLLL